MVAGDTMRCDREIYLKPEAGESAHQPVVDNVWRSIYHTVVVMNRTQLPGNEYSAAACL